MGQNIFLGSGVTFIQEKRHKKLFLPVLKKIRHCYTNKKSGVIFSSPKHIMTETTFLQGKNPVDQTVILTPILIEFKADYEVFFLT